MKYKVLALDIDDTLISNIVGISQRNLDAIARAQRAGVFVTLATGRGYFGSKAVSDALNIDGPLINYGGAVISDARTGKALHSTAVDDALVHEVFDIARERGLYAHLYQGDTVVVPAEHAFGGKYTSALHLPLRVEPKLYEMHWKNVPKVLMIVEPELAETLIPEMQQRFVGKLKISASKPGFIEFNNIASDKGTGLMALAGLMGCTQAETAAVGDNTLDEEMIAAAGLGAAVGNASQRIKEIADVILPSCDEDGVAYFIDNYILGDKAI